MKADPLLGLLSRSESTDRGYFEDKVVESFADKAKSGISIPNYPQFRDMSEMFLSQIDGLTKTANGYEAIDRITCTGKKLEIPEVEIIKEREKEIYEKVGGSFNIKICVTGPYTLASLFVDRRSQLFTQLADAVAKFVSSNTFTGKLSKVTLVAVDEPVFGLVDDPLLDYGSNGREELLRAWETVFHEVKTRNAQSIIHIHNTTNALFWQVKSLDIIESHVGDPLYSSPKTKEYLEKSDKSLKASIGITDFDKLIKNVETSRRQISEVEIGERIADVWKHMRKGELDPTTFLESSKLIRNRLDKIVQQFGERVLYAGPECGLKSFPTYTSAIECLRRISQAVVQLETHINR